ncbi:MAG: RHS repeat protein, partial [Theionarchaea archaeon]|nr:RHS repeat protein [Theionarchaea archaeon]
MRIGYTGLIVAILVIGLMFNVGSLAARLDYLEGATDEPLMPDQSFDRLRHVALNDAVSGAEEYYGFTETPEYQPLEIHQSDDPLFDYMAVSPYYKVYFKGTIVKMSAQKAWIAFGLTEKGLGEILRTVPSVEQNSLVISEVFESVDISYEVESSVLREAVTLREPKQIERFIQKISWGGITPEFQEDGSILFSNEEKKILKILPPFMKDAKGAVCTDLHHELIQTERGHELHKVIDEKGLSWLKNAVYPVVIDPSMQTIEDAWESSGLTPYGQYFKNLKEYVNPATGYLTITQTDLVIPGRGLDLVLSRVYTTPAVFYGSDPYDFESPYVDVGKGWQLNFPWVGKYLTLLNGKKYKIEWDIFFPDKYWENHEGDHFILEKKGPLGNKTHTLTMASGLVYKLDSIGKITEIKDLDGNTITFNYTVETLTSITDTIGRTISLSYSDGRLWKITYNNNEMEFSYDANGCLVWMEDFLNKRTSYYYNTGYNNWLLSKIEYPTDGYTTYTYDRFSDSGYYKYYVTDQKVYETNQVRHAVFSYTGDFDAITASTVTVKDGSDTTKGSYEFAVSDGLITERVTKNSSGTAIRKRAYTYNSSKAVTQEQVYNNGTTLSYTNYYAYDDWGNCIYYKNAEGHEQFFSYSNTSTSGFFVDNSDTVIKIFTNAFSNSTVPSSAHTALLGAAEKQDSTYVKEVYLTYDSEAHPTQVKNSFGNQTTWLTFSGTFNESTGDTSFPIDLTGRTVTGNAVLRVTGQELEGSYPEQVQYNFDNSDWETITTALGDDTVTIPVTVSGGSHTLYFSESSSNDTKFSWSLWVPVDNTPDSYTTSIQYDTYGNITSITDAESNTVTLTYSSTYSYAYLTEISVTVGTNTITYKATYDSNRGWITSLQEPKGVDAGSGYDYLYTYDALGRVAKKEFPLLSGQSQRSYLEAVYDDTNRKITIIDQLRHYVVQEYDKLGRLTNTKWYTGTYGSGTLYATASYTYRYDSLISTVTDPGNDTYTYTYDFLGRRTQIHYPDSSTVSYSYDDTNNKKTFTNARGYDKVYWHDWLSRLKKVEEEYTTDTFATTTYQYDEIGHLTSFTDAENHTTSYTYASLFGLTKTTYPDSEYEEYDYDNMGNLTSFTDCKGNETTYTYDDAYRLIEIEYEDQSTVTFTYDLNSNRTKMEDDAPNTNDYIEYSYDYWNRLTSKTRHISTSTYTVSYEYDVANRLTKLTYPNNMQILYSYDDLDRATEIKRYVDGSNDEILMDNVQYDTESLLTQFDYGNDLQATFSYDSRDRLSTLDVKNGGTSFLDLDYTYDNSSNITQLVNGWRDTSSTWHSETESYSYDGLDRLTSASCTSWSHTYS